MNSKKAGRAEEWINDLEDIVMKSNQAEQKRKKKNYAKREHRKHSYSIKCNNICIIGIPEEEDRKAGR